MSTHFDRVRDECHLLLSTHEDGSKFLDPYKILEFAEKHPKSALHEEFTWDDAVCGQKYRLEEARNLIQRIVVYLPGPQGERTEYREYINAPFNGDRYYRPIADLNRDLVARRRAIVDVLKRALAETTKYPFPEIADWQKLTQVLIDQFNEEPPPVKKRTAKRKLTHSAA